MLHTIRILVITIVILALLINAAIAETVIWYIPHPDDETIGMADAICDSVLSGATNYVVFFTQGGSSLVRYRLKGPDGYIYHLTQEELKQARKKEALAALEILGVDLNNVLFLDFSDGNIPLHSAIDVINCFVGLAPDGLHCTVSINDSHDDHRTLARALAAVDRQYGNDLMARYYRVYIYGDTDKEHSGVQAVPLKHDSVKQAALYEYLRWEPENGRYALGGTSMPRLFLNAMMSEYEYLDDTTRVDWRVFWVSPVEFRVFGYGVGVTLYVWNGLLLDASLDFGDFPAFSSHVLFEVPETLPFVRIRIGAGICSSIGRLHGLCHVEIADNFLLEYNYSFGEQGRLKLGIKTRLWL
jgi:LmbE family N-acetylglucosaminyl deacetylase